MRTRFLSWAFSCGALLLGPAPLCHAQESGTPPTTAAEALAEAQKSYHQSVVEFEALRSEYQTADADRRAAIDAELAAYYKLLKPKVKAMVTAAIAAYQEAPNADPEVTKLLLKVAEHDIRGVGPNSQGGDRYERALEIISALVDGGQAAEQKSLPLWGLIAAFTTGELDQAERFKQLADDIGSFNQTPPQQDQVGMEIFGTAEGYARGIAAERRLWEQERKIREAEAAADDLPRVKMTTSAGEVVIELFENEAPTAVANFVTLVKDGFYDGVVFHRVLPRFMAQGGDPTGSGSGGPGYSIACECYEPSARMHFRGSLSMAHAGRDTGGSQFFLTFVPTRHLDGRHTVFGRVIEGFDVLAELQRVEPGQGGANRDQIVKAEVIRDRGHEYSFQKLPGR